MDDHLGRTYKDCVTQFQGIATCVSLYMTGCDRVYLQPLAKDDGVLPEGQWFDVVTIEVVRHIPRILVPGPSKVAQEGVQDEGEADEARPIRRPPGRGMGGGGIGMRVR